MHVVFVAASQRGLPQEGGAAAGGGEREVLRMRRGERERESNGGNKEGREKLCEQDMQSVFSKDKSRCL